MTVAAPLLPGETLGGKYRIERVLGQGGMGVVVAARHLDLDERVAIKFLIGKPSETAADRFIREARAAAKVKGEHVCRVFDFGRLESGEPYIVMEHLEGTDLAKKLEREAPLPPTAVVGWMIEACDALAAAHALGIVHRDLKPANVFLAERPDGSTCAKVLDFGISKLPSQGTMTGPQTTMGSPAYMSPEQMESSRDVDARSDVWSLGVMMYELFSGRPPFVAESALQLALLIREKEPVPLQGIPEELARVVVRCLAKKPEDRYQSVAELVVDLRAFAPAEASALASRISRRIPAATDVALALDATAEDLRPRSTSSVTPEVAAAHARAQNTFEPMQSTVAATTAPPARRWPVAVVAVLVAGVVGVAAQSMSSHGEPEVKPEVKVEAAASVLASEAPAVSALASTPPPPATASAAATTTSAHPVASAIPTGTTAPRLVVTAKDPATIATATTTATTPAAASAAPLAASAATTNGPATKPTADGKKKRELDRDDPL